MRFRSILIPCLLMCCASCSDNRVDVKIPFVVTWGGEPIGCEGTDVLLSDLRFYVSAPSLSNRDGTAVALELDASLPWQQGNIALVDLENGRGACRNGTAETFSFIAGVVPASDYRGLEFTIGVPFEQNHANPLTAESPLDDAAMHWHWRSGYKFLRAGVQTPEDGFWIHVGSAGCEGTVRNVTGCRFPNRVHVVLPEYALHEQTVEIDLMQLLEGTSLADGERSDCSSGPPETACVAPFAILGLDFQSGEAVGSQRLVALRP